MVFSKYKSEQEFIKFLSSSLPLWNVAVLYLFNNVFVSVCCFSLYLVPFNLYIYILVSLRDLRNPHWRLNC